jgi:glycosyltransferase involved in cell wall biosynthesis
LLLADDVTAVAIPVILPGILLMRIAVWHNLPSGGGKRALYYHVKGLVERGHTVEAWCPPTADQAYLPLGEFAREHVVPLDWTPPPDGQRLKRAVPRFRDFYRLMRAMTRHCQQCAAEIDQGGFDLLLANSCYLLASAPIARYARTPAQLYLHEPYRGLYESAPPQPWAAFHAPRKVWWSPRYLKYFIPNEIDVYRLRLQQREEYYSARAFARILVNSYYSRESVLRAYGLASTVVYLGVDTNLFAPRGLRREFMVVGLGSFSRTKNIELVIKALAGLSEPRPRLVWIGNFGISWYIEELVNLARTLQVPFEPRLLVTDEQLVDTLSRASLMAYAPRLEPFGLAPLEANACETPVVAVAEGGVRETIVDNVNGLLVAPEPADMARGIQRLLDDPERAQALGRAGRRLVCEKWSLAAATDRLESNLLSFVEDSRSRPAIS